MSELKPCQRCGKSRIEAYECNKESGSPYFFIHCNDCWNKSDIYSTLKEAVSAWNSRPLEDALNAENAALKEKVAEMEANNARIYKAISRILHRCLDGAYLDCRIIKRVLSKALNGGE